MISAYNNNNPTFTSVMPVRVRIDGRESYSEIFIRPACKKLSAVLLGPTKQTETKKLDIIRTFAQHDYDYDFNRGLMGHPKSKSNKKPKPSDYFRYITKNLEHFFMTGPQAENLKKLGKEVGHEKNAGKLLDVDNSLDLEVARGNYYGAIKNYLKNKNLRLRENYNPQTGERSGDALSLVIDMTSNKKYGQSNFEMDIDKISFERA